MRKPLHALILAGRRPVGTDPLEALGIKHKAFLEICGKPMISRVLEAVSAIDEIEAVTISAPTDVHTGLAPLLSEANIKASIVESAGSPAASISAHFNALSGDHDVLVTTCDHVLLRSSMISEFLEQVDPERYDVAAACVLKETYLAKYPESQRTFIRFRDMVFSGANLFWMAPERARGLLDFWRKLEANRKNPLKMATAIGLGTGAMYLAGQLTKQGALRSIEQKTGARGALVPLQLAEASIDVDKPADIALAEAILSARG